MKSATTLIGGTALSQIIVVAASPLLTRLYSPQDFKLLSVYLALQSLIATVACLRLESAIPLPEADADAAQLLALALLFPILTAASVVVPVLLWASPISSRLGVPALETDLWLLPVGIWLVATNGAMLYWSNRRRRFASIARARISQSGIGVATQLGLGSLKFGPFGLIFGQVLFATGGTVRLVREAVQMDREALSQIRWPRMKAALSAYRRFPQYSTFEALANAGSNQLPLLAIAALSNGAEAGYVFFATRIMGAPLQIVGSAIGDVYLSHAAAEWRAGLLYSYTRRVVLGLALIGVIPLTLISFAAPAVFSTVFGASWMRAGVLVRWMAPWFILQFLSSPVSHALNVLSRQHVALSLQAVGLALRLGAVVGASMLFHAYTAEAFAVSGAVFYGVYFIVVILALRSSDKLTRVQLLEQRTTLQESERS